MAKKFAIATIVVLSWFFGPSQANAQSTVTVYGVYYGSYAFTEASESYLSHRDNTSAYYGYYYTYFGGYYADYIYNNYYALTVSGALADYAGDAWYFFYLAYDYMYEVYLTYGDDNSFDAMTWSYYAAVYMYACAQGE